MAAKKKVQKKTKVETVKKSKVSRPTKKSASLDVNLVSTETEKNFDSSKVKSVSTKTKAALLVAFIIIVFVLYKAKGYFVAATVNNQPITRLAVISELEKRSGQQALDSIISQTLIKQEAKAKGVNITNEEVDAEITKIENSVKAQNQDLNNLLTMQGMTRSDLRDQIQTQKIVEKILASEIEPSDKEVEDYMKSNKDTLPKGTVDEQKSQVKDTLRQQKLSEKYQAWITDVKAKANIKYFVNY